MAAPKLPDRKPYRVVSVGVAYLEPTIGINPDTGEEVIVNSHAVAHNGSEVELTDAQARRLIDLGAIKPKDAPLGYEEQTVDALTALAKERGLDVKGTGANDAVIKDDLVHALHTYDAGAHGS
jgi:hypothetical protein